MTSSLYVFISKKWKRSEDSMKTVWQSVSSRPKALDVMSKWTLSGESTAFFQRSKTNGQTQFYCGSGKSCDYLDNLVKLKHDVLVCCNAAATKTHGLTQCGDLLHGTGGQLQLYCPLFQTHSSVDSQHYSVYVSSICKWWLIIYHSLHQSSELVVCSRPLPLPRTMGPFPVGCEAEEAAKQASIVEQGHHISMSCPWNERLRRTVRFMVCSLGGYRARLQTSHWPLPGEYPENLVGGMLDFVKISMMQHITEKR